ncbi:unnamed protein product, partial [Polarella glacialis]
AGAPPGDREWVQGWQGWRQRLLEGHGSRPLSYRRHVLDGSGRRETHWCSLGDFLALLEPPAAGSSRRPPEPGLLAMDECVVSDDRSLWPVPLPAFLQE